MQIKKKLKNVIRKNKRQKLTLIAALIAVCVCMLTGIFSYFHSQDVVTNRLTAPNGAVGIQEPLWDNKGQYKAKASEPGMTIEKNPSGVNTGQVDVYIRLVMTIDASTFNSKNDTYDASYQYSEAERVNRILDHIKLANGDAFLNAMRTSTNNANFIMDKKTDAGTEKTTYYFYYIGDDAEQKMKVVKPGEKTADLFDHIDIPIYKKDYFGVFDQPYDIILTAEGVPAANYPDGLTVTAGIGTDENPSPFN
ncbi:MAG: hypothetical protein IKO47_13075 [Ruminococcus sp.]|nr:hypothetical protein [Ruminococcus sp.]